MGSPEESAEWPVCGYDNRPMGNGLHGSTAKSGTTKSGTAKSVTTKPDPIESATGG